MILLSLLLTSCRSKLSISAFKTSNLKLSGLVDPFVGKISHNSTNSYLIQTAHASTCADPVVVKLFKIQNNGSINDENPIETQTIGADARYDFSVKDLSNDGLNVSYLVKAEGCNGDVYKRPVTNFDSKQDINAKTSVIAEVINASSLVTTTLNEAPKIEVEKLINSINGTSISSALTSLQTEVDPLTKFTEIFGSPPAVIQDAKPEVTLSSPNINLNELSVATFRINTFHADPNYSFAYSWKLNGVVKSSASIWNHTPSANESGRHQIDVYAGKNDGNGNIDLSKPYYVKTFEIVVNNNIPASVPNISLNSANPTPVNTTSVSVDIATGVSMDQCASFSHMAFTDTPVAPGTPQFNIDCSVSGTQTQVVTFTAGDGAKTLYLWTIDHEGFISSSPKTLSLILDTLPPTLNLNFSPGLLKGGSTQDITLSASDSGTGLSTLRLYYSATGSAPFTLISNVPFNNTSYSWTAPAINSSNTVLQLIATDFTGQETTVYSSPFTIDSSAPSAPALTRATSANSNSTIVNINTVCSADYDKILYSENSSTPALSDSSWENCSSTKNFTVSSADGTKNIYAFTKDLAGNISASSTVSMVLDRSAPAAPIASLHTPAISTSTGVNFTMADCLDRPYIFVSESIIAPLESDANWISCNTGAGAIAHILTGPAVQGNHNIYLFAKDSVGNISLPNLFSMIYDTTDPVLNLSTTITSLYRGGQNLTLNFSAADDYGVATIGLEYAVDGVNFLPVTTLAGSATSYTWTIPANNTNLAKIRLIASDNSQVLPNEHTVTSSAFAIDSIAPSAPTLTRNSLEYTTSATVTMTIGSCTDTSDILFTETNIRPAENEAGWLTCSTNASEYSKIVSGQGPHNIYAWAKDPAGNVASTANSITMTLDTINPSIVAGPTTPSFLIGGSAQTIMWTVSDATTTTIKLEFFNGTSWSDIATGLANNGSYNWSSVPLLDVLDAKIRLTAQDAAGNTSQVTSANIAVDSTPPQLDSISINNGALTTTNNNVEITLSAHDDLLKIRYFCFKYDDATKPAINDSCWKDVTAPTPGIASAKNISFTGYYYQIGFTKGPSIIYAWVKDESGQVSNNSGTNNTDSYSITFDPGTPPHVANLSVTNSDSPGNPVTSADLIAPLGSDVYVKWSATDNEGLAANPITLSYTTNDTTFNAITGGANLINGSNGGCTVNAGYTGCAKIASIGNGYFKIRVIAKDTLGTSVFLNSAPLNETKIKLIAGNTEDGIGGSATTATFNIYGSPNYASFTSKNRLVVSEDGKFFYIDPIRGLLWIDPNDGVLRKFINTTGTSTGDNGPVSSATLRSISAIALDFKNNLLIWDYNVIRKVNLSTMIITKIVGGGAQADPLTTVNASDITVPTFNRVHSTFIPMPNGDIIFGTTSLHDRKFRAIDNQVELIDLQGEGFTNYPTDSWTTTSKVDLALAFNPVDSTINFMMKGFVKIFVGDSYPLYAPVNFAAGSESTPYTSLAPFNFPFTASSTFTGLDGNIYVVDRFRRSMKKYNYSNNTITTVLGTSSSGFKPCAEETAATSCAIALDSFFVTKNGRIYFIDNGVLRTINDSGNVISLFGQYPSFGHNVLATDARFGNIIDFKMGKVDPTNDKIMIADLYAFEFRELTIGGNINKIANMTTAVTRIETDPLTGDIFAPHAGGYLQRFVRTANTWNTIVGGGVTKHYYEVDAVGVIGSQIRTFYYPGKFLGLINNKLFVQDYNWTGTSINGCFIRTFDVNDSYKLDSFMGADTCSNTAFDTNLTLQQQLISTYNISNIEYIQDPIDSVYKYFFTREGENKIYNATASGNINIYANLSASSTNAFTHKFDTDGSLMFYYCGANGYLYQYKKSTGITQMLSWLSPTFRCKASGKTIIYNSERNSVIFSYTQNGLDGIAEYDLN